MQSKPAGFWLRFQAHVIDALLLLLLVASSLRLIVAITTIEKLLPPLGLLLYVLAFLLPVAILLYRVVMTVKFGGGVGKLVSGIKVVTLDGQLLKYPQALFRFLVGYFVSGIFYGLGYLWILKDKERRGWHDLVSDTRVTRKEEKRWIVGTAVMLCLLVLTSGIIYSSIQSIKENGELQSQISELVEEVKSSLLENSKTPVTIEPQVNDLII